jgi:hypothetical protein
MIDYFNLWLVGYGSFLARFHMRGRKPRHISSETEKFWLVGYISNPNKYKGYNRVRFFLAGHWSLLAGHPPQNNAYFLQINAEITG